MYFKILSIAVGVLMVVKGPVMHLAGRRWPRFAATAAYPEKQPFGAWVAGVGGLIVIAVTWWMQLRQPVAHAWIATLVVTLTLVMLSQMLFNYRRFRAFALKVMKERPGYFVVLNVAAGVLGGVLILLGILVY
ncbi:MAG TPA: hypothetical protein VMZ92_16855 [Planctomycetota bacterium]|nr:hypothetical protein [Planctomycetota bacterium]